MRIFKSNRDRNIKLAYQWFQRCERTTCQNDASNVFAQQMLHSVTQITIIKEIHVLFRRNQSH